VASGFKSSELEFGSTPAERQALDRLFSATYEELRRLASSVKRSDPSATLSPTTLVNEAWLKLADSSPLMSISCLHFKRIAARAMRQVLVEAARRRRAHKRGGGEALTITFDDSLKDATSFGEDVLAPNTALDDLARMSPRQATMVECRFFATSTFPKRRRCSTSPKPRFSASGEPPRRGWRMSSAEVLGARCQMPS
jgi:RNA polymerase sigma factor (TIGR02999 family)